MRFNYLTSDYALRCELRAFLVREGSERRAPDYNPGYAGGRLDIINALMLAIEST